MLSHKPGRGAGPRSGAGGIKAQEHRVGTTHTSAHFSRHPQTAKDPVPREGAQLPCLRLVGEPHHPGMVPKCRHGGQTLGPQSCRRRGSSPAEGPLGMWSLNRTQGMNRVFQKAELGGASHTQRVRRFRWWWLCPGREKLGKEVRGTSRILPGGRPVG